MQKRIRKFHFVSKDEEESFWQFVETHFIKALDVMESIIKKAKPYIYANTNLQSIIYDKLTTPLFYLKEEWDLMPLDEKEKYATANFKKELEKIKKEIKETQERIEEIL
ncbi:MAG: hypothetical protein QXT31_03980 [Candidatus Bathyarchaeia archaeon]